MPGNVVRRLVRRPWRLVAEVPALLIAAVVAFPLYWMVLSAFKPAGEIESTEPCPWQRRLVSGLGGVVKD